MNSISSTSQAVVLALLGFCACSSPTYLQPPADIPLVPIPLDRDTVADIFGDFNAVTSGEELEQVDSYFASHHEAWCLSYLGEESWECQQLSSSQVKAYFTSMATHPYASEQSLRLASANVSVRTPYVSIAVLVRDSTVVLTRFYRSPGSRVGQAQWQQLEVH